MSDYTAVNVDEFVVNTPPPYMDPGNSVAKKKMSRLHKASIASSKPCEHCGANPAMQRMKSSTVQQPGAIWPAARPLNHIQQDSCQFLGYVVIIAVVIFLLFAACKYLP